MSVDAGNIIIPNLPWIIGGGMSLGFVAIGGWIFTTWLRVRNGYPLENSWGKPVYPQKNEEMVERVRLLSQENAQLRAELGSIKDRLVNVERIVTDSSLTLTHEIDRLRGPSN
jgi:hypothetical protein